MISQQAQDLYSKSEDEASGHGDEKMDTEAKGDEDEASVDTQPLTKEELDTMIGELERQFEEEEELRNAGPIQQYEDDKPVVNPPPSSPTRKPSFSQIQAPSIISHDLVVDPTDLSVQYVDKWDGEHVKLPTSPQNSYRKAADQSVNLPKWYIIYS